MKRRIVIHTDTRLRPVTSKIEEELVRYLNNEIIGIIDPFNSGKTVEEVLGFGGKIPIASSLDEFLTQKPNYLLIGASSFKGTFPMEWYPMVIRALQMRVHIINGLHQSLCTLAEFDLLAKKYKAKILDLRSSGEKPTKFRHISQNIKAKKILIAGANMNSGILPTTLELIKAIHKNGLSADWLPTGLSSHLIKNKGFIAESLQADLISGYIENSLSEMDKKFEYLLIEGQGAVIDPINAGVSINILQGTMPDAIIMSLNVESKDHVHLVEKCYDHFKQYLRYVTKAPIIAISLNTSLLSDADSEELLSEVRKNSIVPVFDPVRSEITRVLEAVKAVEKLV